jgi:hypothetical protein
MARLAKAGRRDIPRARVKLSAARRLGTWIGACLLGVMNEHSLETADVRPYMSGGAGNAATLKHPECHSVFGR